MSPFQLIIRLQQIRAFLVEPVDESHSPRRLRLALADIRSLAGSAAELQLFAFEEVCDELLGRIERRSGQTKLQEPVFAQIGDWAASAELYLRRPHYRPFARLMVLHLNDPCWRQPLDNDQHLMLIDRLTRRSTELPSMPGT